MRSINGPNQSLMRFINREFYRFVFWGGVNTLTGYLFYVFLLLFLPYLISYSAAFVFSIFVSYVLNSKFVFNQELGLRKAIKYPLVYVNQYVLGAVSLYLLVHFLQVSKLVAPLLVVVLTIPVTYFLSRRILRGKKSHQNPKVC
jgi:putative flippase GtrA